MLMMNGERPKCSTDLCCCFLENGFSAKSVAIICMESIIFCVAVSKREIMSDTEIWLLSAIVLIMLIFQLANISFLIAVTFLNYANRRLVPSFLTKHRYLFVTSVREFCLLFAGIALILFIDSGRHAAMWAAAANLGICAFIAAIFWKMTVYREEELGAMGNTNRFSMQSVAVNSDGTLVQYVRSRNSSAEEQETEPPKYSVVNLVPPSYTDVLRTYPEIDPSKFVNSESSTKLVEDKEEIDNETLEEPP